MTDSGAPSRLTRWVRRARLTPPHPVDATAGHPGGQSGPWVNEANRYRHTTDRSPRHETQAPAPGTATAQDLAGQRAVMTRPYENPPAVPRALDSHRGHRLARRVRWRAHPGSGMPKTAMTGAHECNALATWRTRSRGDRLSAMAPPACVAAGMHATAACVRNLHAHVARRACAQRAVRLSSRSRSNCASVGKSIGLFTNGNTGPRSPARASISLGYPDISTTLSPGMRPVSSSASS
jgi:hypothetical protein